MVLCLSIGRQSNGRTLTNAYPFPLISFWYLLLSFYPNSDLNEFFMEHKMIRETRLRKKTEFRDKPWETFFFWIWIEELWPKKILEILIDFKLPSNIQLFSNNVALVFDSNFILKNVITLIRNKFCLEVKSESKKRKRKGEIKANNSVQFEPPVCLAHTHEPPRLFRRSARVSNQNDAELCWAERWHLIDWRRFQYEWHFNYQLKGIDEKLLQLMYFRHEMQVKGLGREREQERTREWSAREDEGLY